VKGDYVPIGTSLGQARAETYHRLLPGGFSPILRVLCSQQWQAKDYPPSEGAVEPPQTCGFKILTPDYPCDTRPAGLSRTETLMVVVAPRCYRAP